MTDTPPYPSDLAKRHAADLYRHNMLLLVEALASIEIAERMRLGVPLVPRPT